MKRLATAAVATPLALLAIFALPTLPFSGVFLVLIMWCAVELVELTAGQAPDAARWLLLLFAPPAAGVTAWILAPGGGPSTTAVVLVGGLFFGVGVGTLVLVGGVPPDQTLATLGIICFGVPYFAFPVAAAATIHRIDPWLVLLLCAIVWLGDTAAFYIGTAIGRHRLAPSVSPKKSWEGAIAGFVTALIAGLVWIWLRLDALSLPLLAVIAVTAVASQLGDLMESLLKRGAHVKDSGNVLPGHGGMLDRMDAMLFAAPVFLAGLWLIGWNGAP